MVHTGGVCLCRHAPRPASSPVNSLQVPRYRDVGHAAVGVSGEVGDLRDVSEDNRMAN